MGLSAEALEWLDEPGDTGFVPPRAPPPPAIDVGAIKAAQDASVRQPDPPPPPALRTVQCADHGGEVPAFWGGRKGPTEEHPEGSCWFCAVERHKAGLGERYEHPRRRRAQPAPAAAAAAPLRLPDFGQPPVPPDREGWGG